MAEQSAHGTPAAVARPRTEKWALFNVILAIAATVIAIIAVLYGSTASDKASSAQRDVRTLKGVAASANSKLTSNGLAPVPTPSVPGPLPTVTVTEKQPLPGATGATGPTGPAPSAPQIQTAVNAYCAANSCGKAPSAAQVAQAVATYCNPNGQCRGAVGASGSPGQNATADQVAAAVVTYCTAHNSCAGPSGAPGVSGAPGASGAPGSPGPSGANGTGVAGFTFTVPGPGGVTTTTYTCTPDSTGSDVHFTCTQG